MQLSISIGRFPLKKYEAGQWLQRGRTLGRWMLIWGTAGLVGGCAGPVSLRGDGEAPSAWIRVWAGEPIAMHPGLSCYDLRNPQRVRGKDVLGGLLPNRRLGMPVAEDTPWGFDEYEVRAGEVITFEMGDRSYHWQDRVSCHLSGVYFVPEPGKKYEVFKDRKLCNIRIRELVETASGKAAVAAVTSRTAGECAAKK